MSGADTPAPEVPSVGIADAAEAPPPAQEGGEAKREPVAPQPPDEDCLRLAEALVFASASPVTPRALGQLLPENVDAEATIEALAARYAGRGVELVRVVGGVQFRSAPDLAPRLRKVVEIPRRLPRAAMETLAIVAYHQPVTRGEIEEIRGASLSQQTLDALLEAGLVAPKGRRESPGRPTLWGTTPAFLARFGLPDLRALPRREDLLVEPVPVPTGAEAAERVAVEDEPEQAMPGVTPET
ncbi:MAG: SMC-Scp complex subunit ScpB [Proteobacteria bacterium]|nr:SMC-Scp complex subunit ScpB [Pseudomonadota bacterium]